MNTAQRIETKRPHRLDFYESFAAVALRRLISHYWAEQRRGYYQLPEEKREGHVFADWEDVRLFVEEFDPAFSAEKLIREATLSARLKRWFKPLPEVACATTPDAPSVLTASAKSLHNSPLENRLGCLHRANKEAVSPVQIAVNKRVRLFSKPIALPMSKRGSRLTASRNPARLRDARASGRMSILACSVS